MYDSEPNREEIAALTAALHEAADALDPRSPQDLIHWHEMNGESGCTPDNNEIYRTRSDAKDGAIFMFDDTLCDECYDLLKADLDGDLDAIHYFERGHEASTSALGYCGAGATYVSITSCTDLECIKAWEDEAKEDWIPADPEPSSESDHV